MKLLKPLKLFFILLVIIICWILIGITDLIFEKSIQIDEIKVRV